ncbi:response regulator receiver and ANTAR domain protein [Thermodesulfatator indicus DSM 15286]|uniref:Response regulator receiver and ANTAR domain protein n=1 Tax=Thermodesulfatator indicus (strain DSM 15286 / JCM 11887 / CIR29812) TaxID=667014 RepID=F8AA29_THEID|nr:response regulator [Thermodesulfatator indicus]AEH45315.1 response regulator receiver and ANTAR domain protein [Thermodesulfatator indicus DSM 15286]
MSETKEKIKVLVAEDDEYFSSSLLEALKRRGYEALGPAQTGKEALELAKLLKPDVIIMDIRMPEMDGLEAAYQINQNGFLPIIILTAYTDPDFLRRACKAKVLGYLLKPISIDELLSSLEVALTIGRELNSREVEIKNLREELEARKIIERAKGFLMDAYNMKEGEAMRFMQQEARRRRVKLKDLAAAIVEVGEELLKKAKK